MNNDMNFMTQNGEAFRFHGAQAAEEQQQNAGLDLFAEELSEHHELLSTQCVATAFTAGTWGGTVSSFSTYGSFS